MSKIEWTDETWNPVVGCARVSEGCRHCYAETMAGRLARMGLPEYEGLTTGTGPKTRWTGVVRCLPERLAAPLGWRKPRKIFVNSMSDLFHPDVPFGFIAAVFGVMAACPRHTFQILTKRPETAVAFFGWLSSHEAGLVGHGTTAAEACRDKASHAMGLESYPYPPLRRTVQGFDTRWPLPNVHLGVSVEDQRTADERIPHLLRCPAAVRWVSAEPLLGPVDLGRWLGNYGCHDCGARFYGGECYGIGVAQVEYQELDGAGNPVDVVVSEEDGGSSVDRCPNCGAWDFESNYEPVGEVAGLFEDWTYRRRYHREEWGIDWVVCGGESGPGARPMHPDWARSLRDQCKAAGAPFAFKQWGAWSPSGMHVDDDGNPICRDVPITMDSQWPSGEAPTAYCDDGTILRRVGKAKAGRLLDGVVHDAYPTADV